VAAARVGIEHRYGYTLQFGFGPKGTPAFQNLIKLDLQRGSTEIHTFPEGYNVSEPTFVPAAGSDPAGDEGWIMLFAHDENSGKSEFAILDASDFSGEPVARVKLPQRVPYGFHGSWMPDAA
jgi:carotenoid cleavage dioxygenase